MASPHRAGRRLAASTLPWAFRPFSLTAIVEASRRPLPEPVRMRRAALARAVVVSVAFLGGVAATGVATPPPAWAQGGGGSGGGATIEDRKVAAKEFADGDRAFKNGDYKAAAEAYRSEEHTSELQSRENLVCRLLLE